jgi:hypothetical protein
MYLACLAVSSALCAEAMPRCICQRDIPAGRELGLLAARNRVRDCLKRPAQPSMLLCTLFGDSTTGNQWCGYQQHAAPLPCPSFRCANRSSIILTFCSWLIRQGTEARGSKAPSQRSRSRRHPRPGGSSIPPTRRLWTGVKRACRRQDTRAHTHKYTRTHPHAPARTRTHTTLKLGNSQPMY